MWGRYATVCHGGARTMARLNIDATVPQTVEKMLQLNIRTFKTTALGTVRNHISGGNSILTTTTLLRKTLLWTTSIHQNGRWDRRLLVDFRVVMLCIGGTFPMQLPRYTPSLSSDALAFRAVWHVK
jgi:hypothetical protein